MAWEPLPRCVLSRAPASTAARIWAGSAAVWPIATTTPLWATAPNELGRSGELGRHRQDPNPPGGGVLQAAGTRPSRAGGSVAADARPRAVFGRNVRAFQVDPRDPPGTSAGDASQAAAIVRKAVREHVEPLGRQRRAELRHAEEPSARTMSHTFSGVSPGELNSWPP